MNAPVAAAVTAFGMTAKRGGAALRDGGHDAALGQRHGAFTLIGWAELAEHVGQFQPGTRHGARVSALWGMFPGRAGGRKGSPPHRLCCWLSSNSRQ